jgi:hypothetical protein
MEVLLAAGDAFGGVDEASVGLQALHLLDLPGPVTPRRRPLAPPAIVSTRARTIAGGSAGDDLVSAELVLVAEVLAHVLVRVRDRRVRPPVVTASRVEEDRVVHWSELARRAVGVGAAPCDLVPELLRAEDRVCDDLQVVASRRVAVQEEGAGFLQDASRLGKPCGDAHQIGAQTVPTERADQRLDDDKGRAGE